MSKTVAIVQSNYIPWKGYFDLINRVDEFILYDDMQYTRRDWRNRNQIKTPQGLQWLTIPVQVKGKYFQPIKETRISETNWAAEHWRTIEHNYARSPHFKDYAPAFQKIYQEVAHLEFLSQINYQFIKLICELLGIKTQISWSTDYNIVEGKTERLVSLCQQAHATAYLSGPAAKDYIQAHHFEEAGITLAYMDYTGYNEYRQLFPPFEHSVSIIDLVFNAGADAALYMKSF